MIIGKAMGGGREVETLIDLGLRLGNGVIHFNFLGARADLQSKKFFCLGCGIVCDMIDSAAFFFSTASKVLAASAPAWASLGISIPN